MRHWPIRTVLGVLSVIAPMRTPAWAATQDASCYDQPVATVTLEVENHPNYPQSLLEGLEIRKDVPFTRDAYRRSVERLVKFGGFEDVAVSCVPGPGGVAVIFAAVPPHRVTDVVFTGETGLTPGDLEKLLRDRYNGLPNIEARLVENEVVNILGEQGYLDAKVTVRRQTFPNPDRATLIFDVIAGPQARIGTANINITNELAITKARVSTMTELAAGRPYRPGPIRDALLDVVSELKSRGYYAAAFTNLDAQRAGENTFNVSVDITPGPRVTLAWDPTGDSPLPGDINDWVPIRTQNSIDRDLLDDSKSRMVQYLRNQGYSDAVVEILGSQTPTEWPLNVRITRGPRHRIDHVEYPAGLHMSQKDLEAWMEVRRGDVVDDAKINAGIARVANEYWQAGYYRMQVVATVQPAPNHPETAKEHWVVLTPEIKEGPRGQIVQVEFRRATQQVSEADLRAVIQGSEGRPYVVAQDTTDRAELERLYLNLGYRTAKVEIDREFSADGTQVKRIVNIDEGPQVHIIDVNIVGWRDISEQAIREELTLRPGSPYGEAARLDSQRRLYEMGVFRRVSVEAEDAARQADGRATDVHLVVRVVEAPDTTVAFGAGIEAGRTARAVTTTVDRDRLEFYPRGSFEISRRNLGGRNRILSLFTRLSLRPRDVPHDPVRDGRGYVASQYRIALTYQERRAFRSDTDWLFGATSEQAIRAKYNFRRSGGNTDFTRLLSRRTRATARYTIDFTKLYNLKQLTDEEVLDVDRAFPQVRLSTFGVSVISEQRDDPISPTRGRFLAWDGEVAARAIGSEVGYLKTLAQASTYKSLDASKRFILAGRAQIGLARGYTREALLPDPVTGLPVPTPVEDLPASQRFYAGGSTTVRGFQLDRLGTPAVLANTGQSKGGNGLVVLNAELRSRIMNVFRRKLSTAIFVDSGNVFDKVSNMSFGDLRGSVGFGFRYDSPLGPVRVDFGYKLSRITYGNGTLESRWEYHISFGEIF